MVKKLKNNEQLAMNNQEQMNQLVIPTTPDQIPDAINHLKELLKKAKGNAPEEISLEVDYPGEGSIKNVTSIRKLAAISASIKARAKAQDDELVHYGIDLNEVKPFTESGKTVQEWNQIISKAIYEIKNKSKIEKLEKSIKELEQHLSAEEKLKKTLSNIMGLATDKLD
jgi:hypothetical protein